LELELEGSGVLLPLLGHGRAAEEPGGKSAGDYGDSDQIGGGDRFHLYSPKTLMVRSFLQTS
jgi:hypothetical protein